MNKTILCLLAVCFILSATMAQSEAMNTPPTKAFSKMLVNGQMYLAKSYSDIFKLNTTGQIITEDNAGTITVKLSAKTCASGEAFTRVDDNGVLICAVPMP